ncbi:hypothetical protein [Corynebacterium sp.]|uniref:hypothetical protein n=1 Tax=Corynebacterium sp. TaxID=1720 RepID=UPI0025BF5394|nr:hypothetical protein [Corynebacterium sp.]
MARSLPKTFVAASFVVALSWVVISTLGRLGVLVAVVLVITAVVTVVRQDSDREIAALKRSIDLSATDIAAVLDDWDEFRYSSDPARVRDRQLHRPELCDARSGISSVSRFHAAAGSCERFLRHLPERTTSLTTVATLTELLHETDQRALSLQRLWDRARQDSANSRHH